MALQIVFNDTLSFRYKKTGIFTRAGTATIEVGIGSSYSVKVISGKLCVTVAPGEPKSSGARVVLRRFSPCG
jgi:hypothetical protein